MSDLLIILALTNWITLAWLVFITWKLWQYRCAIIRCQEHIAWMLEYLTTPNAGEKIPSIVSRAKSHSTTRGFA